MRLLHLCGDLLNGEVVQVAVEPELNDDGTAFHSRLPDNFESCEGSEKNFLLIGELGAPL